MEEVSISLLEKFSIRDWRTADRDLVSGRITLRATMEREFGLLRASRREMERFVQSIRLRPGFRRLLAAARRHGAPLVIVSEGLDFYIRAFLEQKGIQADFWANHAVFTKRGIVVEHPFSDPDCEYCGTCKKARLLDLKKRGYTTVYIGDGISDRCPAREADVLFARDGLLDYCVEEGLGCFPYGDFRDVLAVLERRFWKRPAARTARR